MIVDANIVVHWFAVTEFSSAVARFRDRDDLRAPALILVEAANVLYKNSRWGTIEPSRCGRSIRLLEYMLAEVVADSSLLWQAIELAVDNNHPVHDCLYLSLALDRREPLITADKRLAAIALSIGIEAVLIEPA